MLVNVKVKKYMNIFLSKIQQINNHFKTRELNIVYVSKFCSYILYSY